MKTRQTILQLLEGLLKENEVSLQAEMTDELVLLETGLDSLAFAVLVVRLDEELGYDPFVLMSEPVYPRTLGEFVKIYEQFANHGRAS